MRGAPNNSDELVCLEMQRSREQAVTTAYRAAEQMEALRSLLTSICEQAEANSRLAWRAFEEERATGEHEQMAIHIIRRRSVQAA